MLLKLLMLLLLMTMLLMLMMVVMMMVMVMVMMMMMAMAMMVNMSNDRYSPSYDIQTLGRRGQSTPREHRTVVRIHCRPNHNATAPMP